jgi:hypothetical protein
MNVKAQADSQLLPELELLSATCATVAALSKASVSNVSVAAS